MRLLRSADEIEWARATFAESRSGELPFWVWRFKQPQRRLEQCIEHAVLSFHGEVEWEIYQGGRNKNWVLAPKRLREFQTQYKIPTDSQACRQIQKTDPEFVRSAVRDIPSLETHLLQALKAGGFDVRPRS